jgi:hypothetical protein
MGSTTDQNMVAVAWDALYDTTPQQQPVVYILLKVREIILGRGSAVKERVRRDWVRSTMKFENTRLTDIRGQFSQE